MKVGVFGQTYSFQQKHLVGNVENLITFTKIKDEQPGMILDGYTTVLMCIGIRCIDLEISRDVLNNGRLVLQVVTYVGFRQQLLMSRVFCSVHRSSPSSAAEWENTWTCAVCEPVFRKDEKETDAGVLYFSFISKDSAT